jgi:hypothetical protein
MRPLICVSVLLLLSISAVAQASLGDFARQQRASRPATPARVITNEDLPGASGDKPSAPATAAAQTGDAENPAKATPSASPLPSPVQAFKDKERAFRARYAEQKRTVEQLSRQLKVAEHEYDVQTTTYWADAGTRLRQNDSWVEKRAHYEKEIDDTRSQLNAAQQRLDEIGEEAHRAGLSESSFEPQAAGPDAGLIP